MFDTLVIAVDKSDPLLDQMILGVRFLDRIVLPAKKAGISSVLFRGDPLPEQYILIKPEILLSTAAWKQICSIGGKKRLEISYDSIADFQLHSKDWCSVKDKTIAEIERWLLQGLIKDNEGFMSKHFERKISLAVTRRLIRTSATPNQMTMVSIGIGLIGAVFFIPSQKWYDIAGSLLFWLHSVLDGCDGEIARLKFLESRWGGVLDFWGDNVVHAAVFTCMAYGFQSTGRLMDAGDLGLSAVAGTLASAGWTYWHTIRIKEQVTSGPAKAGQVTSDKWQVASKGKVKSEEQGPVFRSVLGSQTSLKQNKFEKVTDFLARRDFIYLVILLALAGRLDLFLWMGAIGAPIYFVILLYFKIFKR